MQLKNLVTILRKNLGIILLVLFCCLFCWKVQVMQAELQFLNSQILNNLERQRELMQDLQKLKPYRKKGQEDPDLTARAAISVLIGKESREKILFEKDIDKILPIASVSKLMTAYVSLKNYEESYRTNNLLHLLLVGSSNWASEELAQIMGQEEFILAMNSTAQELGLENTYFSNPSGLDQEDFNYSTAKDLVKFTRHLFEEKSPVWRISLLKEYNGVSNTNELLGRVPGIIGGKTGGTIKAGECLVLLTEAPDNQGYIISIILGSAERFAEMERLLNWVQASYIW